MGTPSADLAQVGRMLPRTVQRCATHPQALLIAREVGHSTSGLWCQTGHWCERWTVVDRQTGRVLFTASRNGFAPAGVSRPVAVLISGWACNCVRCGHAWVSRCSCMIAESVTQLRHGEGCRPPRACAKCNARNWNRPADYVGGQ